LIFVEESQKTPAKRCFLVYDGSMNDAEKEQSMGDTMSCEDAEKLMEKERDKELEHVERDGLFAHCKLCADCRAKQQEIRNTLLGEGGLG
jgi:hypothetical protein